MSRVVFLNGAFLPAEEAKVSVMDRGFLFSDGVYEGVGVLDGHLVDNEAHLERFERSMREIQIANPHSRAEWTRFEDELVRRNGMSEGFLYIQITRGVAERDFMFPKDAPPTVMMFTQAKSIANAPAAEKGIAVITVADQRWKRRDIKSVSLLAQVLAKQAASEAGAQEAWMVEDGFVTEGGSSSAFIVTQDGQHRRASAVERDPARHHPQISASAVARRPELCLRSGCLPSRKPTVPPRHFSPARRISSCLSSPSTGVPSAMEDPAPITQRAAAPLSRHGAARCSRGSSIKAGTRAQKRPVLLSKGVDP